VLAQGVETAVLVALNLSALCHYLGFATPRWLRQVWQLPEFSRFLKTVAAQPAAERADRALDELCRAAAYVTGGLAAAVALAGPDPDTLRLHAPAAPALSGPLPLPPAGALRQAWDTQRPAQAVGRANFGLPPALDLTGPLAAADVLLIVPLASVERRWGLLLVLRRGQSPFLPDDFSLLLRLTEQTALALDYAALIGQLRAHSVQLEASNKELEAFAYSVSHDLRAPLRAVAGFSSALHEDYGPQLPPEAQGYLDRMQAAVTRMSRLIDDLLDLARVARAELRVEPVDLSALAAAVIDELRQSQPDRQIVVTLQPGLTAPGDSRLLRQVLDNLLGNAWKFTGRRAGAAIEFGAQPAAAGEPLVYFVRDNGAGFDMAHAAQLFTAFQRLHAAHDFPGSGVGLATVERIILRHGGRVWARSAVNEGATFFFTLGLAPAAA
jgi:signal transduction histidine kinase